MIYRDDFGKNCLNYYFYRRWNNFMHMQITGVNERRGFSSKRTDCLGSDNAILLTFIGNFILRLLF